MIILYCTAGAVCSKIIVSIDVKELVVSPIYPRANRVQKFDFSPRLQTWP